MAKLASPLGAAEQDLDPRQAALLKKALAKKPANKEMLDTGQEEVFSRTEVATGEVEHGSTAGSPRE